MRAIGLPERSATEGTLGTKAEAEAHADVAILVNGQRHDFIVDGINEGCVEPFCLANWGDKGACRLTLGDLDADSRALFQTIFTSLMADPVFADQTSQLVDTALIMDKLNIPTKQTESFSPGPAI